MPLRDAKFLRAVVYRLIPVGEGRTAFDGLPETSKVMETKSGYDKWAEIYDTEDNPLIALENRFLPGMLGLGSDGFGVAGMGPFGKDSNAPPQVREVRGGTVADLGCGTGRWTLRLAQAGARVTALDFSEGMLARARQKAAEAGLTPDFLQHDLTSALPLPGDAFDIVLSCLALEHVPALAATFAEMTRICRPDGRIIVTAMHPAMMFLGIEARFTDPQTGQVTYPISARHEISDYVQAGLGAGLRLTQLGEWAVDEALVAVSSRSARYLGWPLLLIMEFRKEA
jgi:SAM-dependent methyltransferase